MRLVRFGEAGAEKPGLLDAQDRIRDLSGLLSDIGPAQLAPASLAALRSLDPSTLPVVPGAPRLGPPVGGIG
jgi:2,4-diketo-3-deoxy-L-fuconate hydrolase